ncbi:hypothetical protein AOXY_G7882 [Acipenser oxyrinchus oxyrinchus]|uniref:Uncharacterized protein n=1 Tax=Acipenser oxyrinchus oxyrinchus TaxID=40147 RepID=A0AAD8GAV2_ACIOX|nr:hypothetical protein AOXY_G7882 [Acipenser oxyrinchus oxyrinchus]
MVSEIGKRSGLLVLSASGLGLQYHVTATKIKYVGRYLLRLVLFFHRLPTASSLEREAGWIHRFLSLKELSHQHHTGEVTGLVIVKERKPQELSAARGHIHHNLQSYNDFGNNV